jgi:hypothetical protein
VKKANTLEGAEQYLKKYPKGKYSSKVRGFIETEYAKKGDTIVGIEAYISKYPNNPKTEELKKQLGEKYYERIKAYPRSYFMATYFEPEGVVSWRYSQSRIEPLIVLQCAIKYLKLFPNGKYSSEIKKRDYFLVSEYKSSHWSREGTSSYSYEYPQDYSGYTCPKEKNPRMYSVDSNMGVFNFDWNSKSFIEKFETYYNEEGWLIVKTYYDKKYQLNSVKGDLAWFRFIYQNEKLVQINKYYEEEAAENSYVNVLSYIYNSKGLLERIEYSKGHNKEEKKGYAEFTYDSYGNLIKVYSNYFGVGENVYIYKHYKVNENGEVMELSGVSQI